jgi:hypothetical protein
MKHKILFLAVVFLLSSSRLFAQAVISGTVVDAETKQPLEGASVIAQNTTRGAVTDKEGKYKLALGKGGYEIIVSYTGYESKTTNVDAAADQELAIELKKEEKMVGEVVLKSSSEVTDGWQQYGPLFLRHFIGSTPFADSCILLNPEVLRFFYYKRNDRVKVLASAPLQIENKALGYNIRYVLDSFVYYNATSLNSYRGACLFQPMEADTAQQRTWQAARQAAYLGSRLHFLRAYYDSSLKEEGFTVDMLTASGNRNFGRLANPYDTAYYFWDAATANAELFFPRKASITYTKAAPNPRFLQQYNLPADVKTQISYVDMADGILIMPNGFFLDQRNWTNQGYWSWKNLADQLPFDYEPENNEQIK